MKIEKRIHPLWKEAQILNKKHPNYPPFKTTGKYQYIYSNKNGVISLVKLGNYYLKKLQWELCYFKNGLKDTIEERFETKKAAELRIGELLGEKVLK